MISKENTHLAILFADVSGSTRLFETLGDKEAVRKIEQCLAILSGLALRHKGEVVKTIGDEILCAFPDATSAVHAARAMQMEMAMQVFRGKLPLRIHIGLHFGQAIRSDGDIFGDAVNIAARIVKTAKADQIIITRQTAETLPGSLRADVRYLGSTALKGKREEIGICEILCPVAGDLTLMLNTIARPARPDAGCLVLRHGDKRLILDAAKPEAILGRDKRNDLVVDNPLASRQHAQIEFRAGKFILCDKSANGTFVFTADGSKTYVHREEFPLSGNGSITLGHDTEGDASSPLTIQFDCE